MSRLKKCLVFMTLSISILLLGGCGNKESAVDEIEMPDEIAESTQIENSDEEKDDGRVKFDPNATGENTEEPVTGEYDKKATSITDSSGSSVQRTNSSIVSVTPVDGSIVDESSNEKKDENWGIGFSNDNISGEVNIVDKVFKSVDDYKTVTLDASSGFDGLVCDIPDIRNGNEIKIIDSNDSYVMTSLFGGVESYKESEYCIGCIRFDIYAESDAERESGNYSELSNDLIKSQKVHAVHISDDAGTSGEYAVSVMLLVKADISKKVSGVHNYSLFLNVWGATKEDAEKCARRVFDSIDVTSLKVDIKSDEWVLD